MVITEIRVNCKFFDHSQQIKMLIETIKSWKIQSSNSQKNSPTVCVQKFTCLFIRICVLPVIFFSLNPRFPGISDNRDIVISTSIKSIVANLFCKWMRSINYMRNFIILQPLRHLYSSTKSSYPIVKTVRLYYVHSASIRNHIFFIFFMKLSCKNITLICATYNKDVCYHD